MKRILLLLVILTVTPVRAQSSYSSVTVTEHFEDSEDISRTLTCFWFDAGDARDMIAKGESPQVILTGNHGWLFCG